MSDKEKEVVQMGPRFSQVGPQREIVSCGETLGPKELFLHKTRRLPQWQEDAREPQT